MQYRKFGNTGFDVSALGMGCMRLPTEDGGMGRDVRDDEAVKLMRAAIDSGVNYLDTAYSYHGGRSECVVGRALKGGYRAKVKLATKCPVWLMKDGGDFDRILDEQLKRLGVDYIDFYLLHALNGALWDGPTKRLGLPQKAEQARASGKIGHLGFSFHGEQSAFFRIVDEYDGWAFCMIQMNYMDEENQAGLKGLRHAAAKGLGVAVMEPLLGGRLACPAPAVRRVFRESGPARSPARWALDYMWDMPEVSVVLSGMSGMEQLTENLAWAGEARPGMFTEGDRAVIRAAREAFAKTGGAPCTGCGYCMPCPAGVNISRNMALYNELGQYETPRLTRRAYAEMKMMGQGRQMAENCEKCGECEAKCPQNIPIAQWMTRIHAALGQPAGGEA